MISAGRRRRWWWLLGFAPATLSLQPLEAQPADPAFGAGGVPDSWWTKPIERKLSCQSASYPAVLGFDFRYWTGVDFQLGLAQFQPLVPGRRLYLLIRAKPDGSPARFFMAQQQLPEASQIPPEAKLKSLEIQMGGGVHVGLGKYQIDAMVVSHDGRACRVRWKAEAKAIAEPLRQEPNTVEVWTPPKLRHHPITGSGATRQRVAIIANADTFGPRRFSSKLSARDRSALIDSIQSLIESWETAEFSLQLLHLERRQVLLSESAVTVGTFNKIDDVLRRLDMVTVDLGSLKRGARGDFFSRYLERETANWVGLDAVVFIGPAWRWFDKLPDSAKVRQRGSPKMFHLAMGPFRFPPENLFKQYVSAQDGQVLRVNWPVDLARGIKKIRSAL